MECSGHSVALRRILRSTRAKRQRAARGKDEVDDLPPPNPPRVRGGPGGGGGGLTADQFRRSVPVIPRAEVAHFALRILAIQTVAFLQFAGEDFRLAFELVDFIVGQLAPLLLDLAFRSISVHASSPSSSGHSLNAVASPNVRFSPVENLRAARHARLDSRQGECS